MKFFYSKFVIFIFCIFLLGCSSSSSKIDENSITELREYLIDDIHTVVGVGHYNRDLFIIKSYDGQTWDIPASAKILEGAVSLDSFSRITK